MNNPALADTIARIIALAEPDLVSGDDGFIVFWPTGNRGAFEAWSLRIIADEIDRRNAPWAKEVERALSRDSGRLPEGEKPQALSGGGR